MNDQERLEWSNLKITNKTFEKTPQERLQLQQAKQKHKDFIKANPNHTGIR